MNFQEIIILLRLTPLAFVWSSHAIWLFMSEGDLRVAMQDHTSTDVIARSDKHAWSLQYGRAAMKMQLNLTKLLPSH